MATIDLGKIKLVWRGTYSGGTAYTVDDVVQHTDGGVTSSFICTTNSTGNAPSTGGSVHGSWAYLAKGHADTVSTTLTTQGDVLYRDGSGLQRLAAGTSGQFLKTQGAGANPVWATADSGKTLGITQFANNTRASISNSTNALIWNGSYTQIKAGSKLLLHFSLSGWNGSGGAGNWKFVYDGTDHNHALKYNYYPSYMISTFGHMLIDGASSTGSKNWEIRYYSSGGADAPFTIFNPSSADDGRINNVANMSNFIIQELDF